MWAMTMTVISNLDHCMFSSENISARKPESLIITKLRPTFVGLLAMALNLFMNNCDRPILEILLFPRVSKRGTCQLGVARNASYGRAMASL